VPLLPYCVGVDIGHLWPMPIEDGFTARFVICDRPPGTPLGQQEGLDHMFGGPEPQHQGALQVTFERFETDERPQRVRSVTVQTAVPTSTDEIARLPWSRLLRAAEALVVAQQRNSIQAWQESAHVAQIATGQPDQRRVRKGRKPLGYEFYAEVARRYEEHCVEAHVHNEKVAPVAKIAEEYGVNRSTAGVWINRARKKGLLPPASNGKAG
jgi:hypothetical protein